MQTKTTTARAAKAAANAAKPSTAKPAAAPKAAKPSTPKPDDAAKAAAVAADAKRCEALRDLAAKYYAGASKAAHMRKPGKRADYIARVTKPVQACADGNPTTRDESGLALCLSGADANGTFDPVALNLDLGIASRLASVAFLTVAGDNLKLTPAGLERAKAVVKRAA